MNRFNERKERFLEIRAKRQKETVAKEIPDYMFETCQSCGENLPYEDLLHNLYVCPVCGHHFPISARERIRQVCDDDSFVEIDEYYATKNIYEFEGYDQKLHASERKTGMHEAVICGLAKIEENEVAIGVMDSRFMMGSMSSVVGEKITRLIEIADEKHVPLIISSASGGARMQEGIRSLVQMAKTSSALKQFSNHGNLYISLLTHPTTGGVSASFAMLGDIIIAEPNALIGFAGRRVIEQTINESLPETFQRSEFLLEKGFIDIIVARKEMRHTLDKLIRLHQGGTQ